MHTQNTWTIGTFSNEEVRDAAAIYAHGRIRPIVYDISGATLEEADANTRLIAAAPDLLAALQNLVSRIYRDSAVIQCPDSAVIQRFTFDEMNAARNAIAKATGGAA